MKNIILVIIMLVSTSLLVAAEEEPTLEYKTIKMEIRDVIEEDIPLPEQALNPGDTLYIDIDSPGGRVDAGYNFVEFIEELKKSNVNIVCKVNKLAASMAFVIFAHCTERIAEPYALLMWHAPLIYYIGYIDIPTAGNILASLIQLSEKMYADLRLRINITEKLFAEYYYSSRYIPATQLHQLDPKFLTLN